MAAVAAPGGPLNTSLKRTVPSETEGSKTGNRVVSQSTGVGANSAVKIARHDSQADCPRADVAQTAERLTCNQQVAGSTPAVGFRRWHGETSTCRGSSSGGRASAFQAERRGFDPRLPLLQEIIRDLAIAERGADGRARSAEPWKRAPGAPRSRARARGKMPRDLRSRCAQVAQSAEHVLGKDEVGGSIPLLGLSKDGGRQRVRTQLELRSPEERYPSGQREQTVNLPAYAFGGSNPPLSILALEIGAVDPTGDRAVRR